MSDGGEMVEWTRLVRDAIPFEPEDDGSFVELVQVGSSVYMRRGRIGAAHDQAWRRVLASAASAEKTFAKRIAAFEEDGYVKDDPATVVRALPELMDKAELAEHRARGIAIFEERFGRFVEAYRALGFDPAKTFLEACVGKKGLHPRGVADACLGCVATVFDTGFTRMTKLYDAEHGRRMSIPDRLVHEFYVGPAYVLALARERLEGRNTSDDDLATPGLADEIAARLIAMSRASR